MSDVISQSVNLILECGYYCNASVRTNNLDGSHYNTPLPAFGTTGMFLIPLILTNHCCECVLCRLSLISPLDALTPIVRSTDTAPNDTASVTIIIEVWLTIVILWKSLHVVIVIPFVEVHCVYCRCELMQALLICITVGRRVSAVLWCTAECGTDVGAIGACHCVHKLDVAQWRYCSKSP